MYIVTLKPDLLEVNARIAAAAPMPRRRGVGAVPDAVAGLRAGPLSGTLYNGHNQVTAQISPGSSDTITVTFEMIVPSISSVTFGAYRTGLEKALTVGAEQRVAQAAGITPPPPPDPASRMAGYALQLFSDVVFGGEEVSDQSRPFTATSTCMTLLAATRALDATQVSFSGTLTASSASPATAEVTAYVPVTVIEFADGLTIPFAGYSDNVLVDYGGLRQLDVPGELWSEPGAISAAGARAVEPPDPYTWPPARGLNGPATCPTAPSAVRSSGSQGATGDGPHGR